MKLVDELRADHELIERVLGSLRTYVARRIAGAADAADGAGFLRFFRLYAGAFHHAREEEELLAALHREAELPDDRGPIAVIREDHRRFAQRLDELEALLAGDPGDPAVAGPLEACATAYAHALWHHIDAENSVLFPEGEARLVKRGVAELPCRPMTPDEREARDAGRQLVERHPPGSDADANRGDACVACPAYGVRCDGLEREWWSELEWEEASDHLPSG